MNLLKKKESRYMGEYCFIASDKQLSEFTVGIEAKGHVIIIEDEANVLNVFSGKLYCYTKNISVCRVLWVLK